METAKSWWEQVRGLMFSRRKKLFFEFSSPKRVSVHTFFVFFPLRISFMDESKTIIEVIELKPFRSYRSRSLAKYMLEEPISFKKN